MVSKFFKPASKSFLATILLFLSVELLARSLISLNYYHYWDEGYRKLMPLRLDSIAYGVLIAYFYSTFKAFFQKYYRIISGIGILILAVLGTCFYYFYARFFDPIEWDHRIKAGFFLETLFFSLISASIAMLIPFYCNVKNW
jgi:hypothetical protein